jgi:uncharacterized protein (DUF305 family)
MNSWITHVALACTLVAQVEFSQPDHSAMHQPPSGVSGESQNFARAMDASMQTMMKDMHTPGYTGDPDIDFLAMMIPHHEGAVEMARLELVYGRDPLTRRLAEDIIASQSSEIAAMKERLAILRRGEDSSPGGFPALHGTRGGAPR